MTFLLVCMKALNLQVSGGKPLTLIFGAARTIGARGIFVNRQVYQIFSLNFGRSAQLKSARNGGIIKKKRKVVCVMTKKEMVARIVELYGKGSKMALWFAGVAVNSDYKRTRTIFFKIIAKYDIDN